MAVNLVNVVNIGPHYDSICQAGGRKYHDGANMLTCLTLGSKLD